MWADGRTDGQTDMKKLIVLVRNFTKAIKNEYPVQDSNMISPNRKTFAISITLNKNFDHFKKTIVVSGSATILSSVTYE
jgi:hypothetical protein